VIGGGRRLGVTFIEVCVSVVLLAVAVIPIFGLITGGLVRTDINASYTTASQLLQGVMSNLLSDSFSFYSIPQSDLTKYRQADGSVAADPRLDPVFGHDNFQTEMQMRFILKNGLRFDIELWVANYDQAGDILFTHLETPMVNYYSDPDSMLKLVLDATDYRADGYSPFHPSLQASQLITGSAWASTIVSSDQSAFTELTDDGSGSMVYNNFKKLVLRVSWTTGRSYRRGQTQQHTRELWLVSFRANLSE